MFEFSVDNDIKLRLLEPRYAAPLTNLIDENRVRLREWLPWLDKNTTVDDTRQFIRTTQVQFGENNGFVAGIWYRGEIAGVIGHNSVDWENKISYIGYWLGAHVEGRGVMTKSCRALVDHAFSELGLNRADIRCATGNTKSCAIPGRLGFQREGVVRQAEWLYDRYVDHVVYGMLASEWHDSRPHVSP
jgi:ribosomal-protein-serine acetyltransferase